MKKLISENPEINCIVVNEVSRLARTKKVLFSVEQYLIDRHIQLRIVEPPISLLNPDNTVNDAAEMIFTLYSQIAESEMRIKMDRFKYGKDRCRREGIWDGTMLPMGYTVDAEQKVIVHPEEAELIRTIFSMYGTGDWSTGRLASELNQRGMTDRLGRSMTQSRIADVLRNIRYTGQDIYPMIVSPEIFQECINMRKSARVIRKNNYPALCLCNRLIICPICGYHFSSSARTYRCFNHHKHPDKCTNNTELNIDMMDHIIWICATDIEISEQMRDLAGKRKSIEDKITVLEEKYSAAKKKADAYDNRFKRLQDMYINGIIDMDALKEKKQSLAQSYTELEESMQVYQKEIQDNRHLIEVMQSSRLTVEQLKNLNDALPCDIEKKKQIVRDHIREIHISSWMKKNVIWGEEVKEKRYMYITVYDKYGYNRIWRYWPRWGFGQHRLEEITPEDI
jgi:hypothetical protein